MPELPEVETVVCDLDAALRGKTLRSVDVRDPLLKPEADALARAEGAKLNRVWRRGKYIVYDFGAEAWIQHLRMTGKMLRADASQLPNVPPSDPRALQLRVQMTFGKQVWVFFDQRRFGTLTAEPDPARYFADRRLAPDPIAEAGEEVARLHYLNKLRETNRPVKSAMLDQRILCGVGNIYADEGLWRAGVHPEVAAASLRQSTAERVFSAVMEVMRAAIAKRGTSMSDYLDINGSPGVFRKYLAVYRRKGMPCRRCGTTIARIRIAGRGTHYCPHCQQRNKR